jgi:hypothetical protein
MFSAGLLANPWVLKTRFEQFNAPNHHAITGTPDNAFPPSSCHLHTALVRPHGRSMRLLPRIRRPEHPKEFPRLQSGLPCCGTRMTWQSKAHLGWDYVVFGLGGCMHCWGYEKIQNAWRRCQYSHPKGGCMFVCPLHALHHDCQSPSNVTPNSANNRKFDLWWFKREPHDQATRSLRRVFVQPPIAVEVSFMNQERVSRNNQHIKFWMKVEWIRLDFTGSNSPMSQRIGTSMYRFPCRCDEDSGGPCSTQFR